MKLTKTTGAGVWPSQWLYGTGLQVSSFPSSGKNMALIIKKDGGLQVSSFPSSGKNMALIIKKDGGLYAHYQAGRVFVSVDKHVRGIMRMLDAGADHQGFAQIPGVGDRTTDAGGRVWYYVSTPRKPGKSWLRKKGKK